MTAILRNGILFVIGTFLCLAACTKDKADGNAYNEYKKYTISYTPEQIVVGEPITFSPGDKANPAYQYVWDFGDGETSHQIRPSHVYNEVSSYVVILEVINTKGKSIKKAVEIDVYANDKTEGRLGLREALAKMKDSIWVCAHRGYHVDRPGNSLASIKGSIEKEIEMDEIDIRQTKDGVLVLSHNATIDEATNGSGKVADMTLEEIQGFNLMFDGRATDQVIPKLSDVLELAKGKIYLDLDIKIDNYNKVFELVKQYGMLSQVTFSIYSLAKAKELIALDDQLVLMPIIHNEDEYNAYINAGLNLSLVQFNSSMYTGEVGSKFVDKAYALGIAFFGNCYMNDPRTPEGTNFNQVDRFIRLKGQIIHTDYPLEVKSYLQAKGLN